MNDRDVLVLDQLDEIISEGEVLNDSAKKYGNPRDYLEMAKVVFDFVKKKGLIIYGGEAIDKNLKHVGAPGIYTETTKPDYDFYSPDYERDSIELCNILYDKGYKYVARFPRIHRGTFGIRANTVDVADITYIPPNVFKKIPRVKINGVYYISPDFVLKNLYQGLIRPRLGANYARWEKDFCRLQQFLAAFKPAVEGKQPAVKRKRRGGRSTTITDVLQTIESKFVNSNPHIVITGQRAFQFYTDTVDSTVLFELITVNHLLEQHVAMIEKILEPYGKLTKEVYSPFLNDLPTRVRLKLGDIPVVDFYDYDHECVASTGQYVNYYFLMHYLYSQMFYCEVYGPKDLEREQCQYRAQIVKLMETRDNYLAKNKLTGFESKAGKFQVFTDECIGIQKTEQEITYEQKKAGIEQYPRYYPEFEYINLKKFKSKIVPPEYSGELLTSRGSP